MGSGTDQVGSYSASLGQVQRYYERRESRWGYSLLLKGRKHFGYYPAGSGRVKIAEAQRLMEDQLADRLGLEPGSRVLDAGSGEGIVAAYLAAQHGLRIVGVDLFERNARLARANSRAAGIDAKTTFLQGSYLSTGLAAGSLDGAYTMETLVHSPDADAALAEFHRLLRLFSRIGKVPSWLAEHLGSEGIS